MPTMNISLPEVMKSFAAEQVQKGEYGSASESARELVRRDQQARSQAKLEEMPIEGLKSGAPVAVTASYWDELKRDLAKRRKMRGA